MNPFRFFPRAALVLVLPLLACAVNPATGRRQFSLISEGQEIQMGREADQAFTAQLGVYPDEELGTFVRRLGQKLSATSERPGLPWSFRVVDDPTVNAFALPGGFLFITRGILASLNSEAEVAGVLGHEIGHVTARHSVSQISRQQLQSLGLGVGSVLSSDLRQVSGVLSSGLQLLNLKYGRGDELQADMLGLRYMTRAGYDPDQLMEVFRTLALASGGSSRGIPEWQSTHPNPENRESAIQEAIAEQGLAPGGEVGRESYLRMIDGMVFGENPRDGYFKDGVFRHPDLRFAFHIRDGWTGRNQRNQVAAISDDRTAVIILTVEEGASTPRSAVNTFLDQDGIRAGRIETSSQSGLENATATFTASSQGGQLEGVVRGIAHGGSVFRFIAYSTSRGWDEHGPASRFTLESFRPERDPEVLAIQPWKIELVEVKEGMSFARFLRDFPSVVPNDVIARINRLSPTDRLVPGTLVKRVVGVPLP